jgi:DNA repair protein RadC
MRSRYRPNPYEPTEERIYMPNPVAPKVSGYEGMTVKYETRRRPGFAFGQAADFVDFADKTGLLDEVRERIYAFYLHQNNRLQGYRLLGSGGRSSAEMDPVVLFGPAVALHSSAVTILHNHPSGGLTFSRDDRLSTYRMIRAGLLLGVRILDHIVVSVAGHVSMEQYGLMTGLLDKANTATQNEVNEVP